MFTLEVFVCLSVWTFWNEKTLSIDWPTSSAYSNGDIGQVMSQCPLATPSLPTMEGVEQLLQDTLPSQLAATSLLRTAARVSWGWHRSWHWQEPEPSRATPTCSPWEPWPPRRRWSRARRRRTDWGQQLWEESPLHHLATVPASRATTPARCPPPAQCTPGKCELSRAKYSSL